MNQNPDGSDNPEGRRLNRYAEIKLINNSDALIKIEQIEVPQHLRPKTDIFYSVLLTQTSDSVFIPKEIQGTKITLTETDHGRLFFTEEFRDRQKSVEILNFAIDNGFPEAMILNQRERENLILFLSDRSEESEAPYTIQIMALKKPVDLKDMSKLGEISQFTCSDGYFRYIRGFYLTHADAFKDLQKITSKFPDAFIIPLYRYAVKTEAKPDDRTTGQTYYTIQFSATRKALDRNKYKNLGNVQTIYGNDGYYRYTLGIYKSRHEAEIELNRIKSLGYGDAFLKKLEKSN